MKKAIIITDIKTIETHNVAGTEVLTKTIAPYLTSNHITDLSTKPKTQVEKVYPQPFYFAGQKEPVYIGFTERVHKLLNIPLHSLSQLSYEVDSLKIKEALNLTEIADLEKTIRRIKNLGFWNRLLFLLTGKLFY